MAVLSGRTRSSLALLPLVTNLPGPARGPRLACAALLARLPGLPCVAGLSRLPNLTRLTGLTGLPGLSLRSRRPRLGRRVHATRSKQHNSNYRYT
jgi:hypothetical protein